MRRQGFVWLGAAVAVLGTAACFTAPVKAGSASRVLVTEVKAPSGHELQSVGDLTFVSIAKNDTVVLGIQVQDNVGNYFSFAAPTLATGSSAVATLVAFPDTTLGVLPGNTFYKALLIGAGTGTTPAIITAAGVTDSVAVKVQ